MPKAIVTYVRVVDKVNRFFGRIAMYMIFAMLAVLLYSSISKAFLLPAVWTLEVAQFLMAAYYILGGGYSMQLHAHVRMDLLYGRWSRRGQAFSDTLTSICLVGYLILLLFGGFSSTEYAIQYKEVSYSSWAPYMWPIKVVMVFGIILMLLQSLAFFFRDLAAARGRTLEGEPLPEIEEIEEVRS